MKKTSKIRQAWNDLRIGTRLTIGVSLILFLTLIVGLVGWYTLESQSRSQILANQAIDLVSALRAARQDEKNYMLTRNPRHIEETLREINTVRSNAQLLKNTLSGELQEAVARLLAELDNYQKEFQGYVQLNHQKAKSLKEMVSQGRELENTAISLRDDQKRELQPLETLAITLSDERQDKREKADDANRIIKLMSEARQKEKNFLLRNDVRYADETINLVDQLIIQAESTKSKFEDSGNKQLAQQIIDAAKQYLLEFKKVIEGKRENAKALNNFIKLGRQVEDLAIRLREDQKQELLRLEKEAALSIEQRREKREKADSANRIIKLMGEARQQEKNFLLRKEQSYAEATRSLVARMLREATKLRDSFQDRQNKALVSEVIQSAKQYLREFNKVVTITNKNTEREDIMSSLGRRVADRSAQLRGDQKLELQRLERQSTRASKQRLDKRIKADAANRIIKLMGEARQQEKNFLLRKEQAYIELTRSLVNQAKRQAQLLRDRFQDSQNRELAERIIRAADIYLKEFEDVVVAEMEQTQQQERMVSAARKIELLANSIRQNTQLQAVSTKETAVAIILVTLALALIIGMATAYLLTNSIAKPIQQLVEVINRLAREDNVDVPLVSNKDEIGQIARALSNFKEVILRRKEKTEAQLLQAEKMAALGDLVAGVAHEINTPIGIAVTGSSHLQNQIKGMERSFSQGALKKSDFQKFIDNAVPTAATIQTNLERASALIKSFKQVAVDQSSQEVREFNLMDYINEVINSLQPKLKKTPHSIRIEGDADILIETVPGAISQVITNLVINSITHGYENSEQSGLIQIRIYKNRDHAIIEYADDGIGMNEETAKHIYEPFFTTRRGSGGSGLGLSIIFNLVTQTLRGNIQCHTAPNEGTRFIITLPLNRSDRKGTDSE